MKAFFDALHRADLFVERQQRPEVVAEVGTPGGVEARRAAALAAQLPVAAAHAVCWPRGPRRPRGSPLESGHGGDAPHFVEDRPLAARVDELALMGGNRTERAASEATPVDIDRELDHLPRRNVALAAVARVRGAFVGEIERVVQLFGRERRVGRRHDDVPVARGFHERRLRFHEVALGLRSP